MLLAVLGMWVKLWSLLYEAVKMEKCCMGGGVGGSKIPFSGMWFIFCSQGELSTMHFVLVLGVS